MIDRVGSWLTPYHHHGLYPRKRLCTHQCLISSNVEGILTRAARMSQSSLMRAARVHRLHTNRSVTAMNARTIITALTATSRGRRSPDIESVILATASLADDRHRSWTRKISQDIRGYRVDVPTLKRIYRKSHRVYSFQGSTVVCRKGIGRNPIIGVFRPPKQAAGIQHVGWWAGCIQWALPRYSLENQLRIDGSIVPRGWIRNCRLVLAILASYCGSKEKGRVLPRAHPCLLLQARVPHLWKSSPSALLTTLKHLAADATSWYSARGVHCPNLRPSCSASGRSR